MKSCPTCRQVYSENYLELCPRDGTPLTAYGQGSYDYGRQGGPDTSQPPEWQPPPGGYYPPPGGYSPYGMPYPPPPQAGGEGLATAALWTGISTAGCLGIGFLLIVVGAASYAHTYSYAPPPAVIIGGVIFFISYIVGLTALILGIVATSMSSRNPAVSKPKAIVGICLGAIPYLLLFIGLIGGLSSRRF